MSIDNKSITSTPSNQDGTSNTNKDSELSKEEKLRKRREQLELWRQKKQQEKSQTNTPTPTPPESSVATDDKKKSRQQRIEEWKKQRLVKEQANKPKTSITIGKRHNNSVKKPALKRSLDFGIDDDEDSSDVKKPKPSLEKQIENNQANHDEDEDELDAYLASITETDSKSSSVIPDSSKEEVEDDEPDEDENEEVDENARFQNLISSKLTKLQKKGKELQTIDHAQENYEPIRKKFYQEPFELSQLSDEGVEIIRQDMDNIKVHGINIPRPILKWAHLSLPVNLSSVINDKLKFPKPSSIQSQALPTILSGRDVIGIAKTGSGKTLSYVLPMIRHIQDQRSLKENEGPIGLILSPTRELALQIQKEILNFTKNTNLRVCCCYGGSSIKTQISELKKGVEIVVATPGRMIDLLAANSGRVTNLKRATYIVLDEADRMFDLGFEPQVTKIFTQIRPDRQTVLFSATFPKKMEVLAKKILVNPVIVIVGGISVVASEIKQEVILFNAEDTDTFIEKRIEKLHEVLTDFQIFNPQAKILIFVEKQNDADELVASLLTSGFPSITLHGGKEQMDRKYAIKEFSNSESGINILVATSIAARGLDVKSLGLVINFDPPNHMEDYVHRVGRTGRAGAKGHAITFVNSDQEKEISNLVKALRLSHSDIDPELEQIADKFTNKVKSGKEKFSSGFGGKGLDNLQEIREAKKNLEKQRFGGEQDEKTGTPQKELSPTSSGISLPDFEIIEGNTPETSGPDTCKFYCRVVINDLPQEVRWNIVQRENLSKIIDQSRTSITTRGQYYAPGVKAPETSNTGTSKLYLLIEGLTSQSVAEANELIKQRMIEGLEKLNHKVNLQPTGRYVV
ncbi:LOW QUALITY PROTEIN: PRP5 Pre-mRNA-processing ATP-dependent RNA helicase PRP5 [Candida maltosa Xu316]